MDVKEIDILGDGIAEHWYYRHKANVLERCLRNRSCSNILDVGAGSGFFSRHLLQRGLARSALCVDPAYEEDHEDMQGGCPLTFRKSIERSSADLVLMMDVLEHVDNDTDMLASYVERSPVGATFVISVPAFQFMWSGHDVFLDHRRRYSLAQLEVVVGQAGLEVVEGFYAFAPVFPVAALTRLLSRSNTPQSQLKQHHPLVNTVLTLLCAMEWPLLKTNRLGGLSAFCVAQK